MKKLKDFTPELNDAFYDWLEDRIDVYNEDYLRELYDDMLDELESTDRFKGSDIMRELDPIAYRCGFSDFIGNYNEILGGDFYSEQYDEDDLVEIFLEEEGYNDEDVENEG